MPFPPAFLDELAARNPIEEVVGQYVNLKRSGSNLFGLCPFHGEKTPSFSVAPDKGIYYCFGCHKGGGVINFEMEIEGLSYPDAVRALAQRVGMEVPDDEEYQSRYRKQERLWALAKEAARFFVTQLYAPTGAEGLRYAQSRGMSKGTLTRFGIGFAPDSWDSLCKAMRAKGYTDEELKDAGLVSVSQKNGNIFDRFRNRLMFPVIDVRGNVIGFSGRILGDGEPKYMNSPETLVFNKSRNLFALNLAKKSKSGYIILSEGNIDVVSLHQAGFDSAVASLGTSLTPEQARLLSRYTNEVIIAYDNDGAGIKASQRAIGILEKLDMKVKVLRVTGAKDPDEFIKTKGPDAFRNLLDGSENQIDYRLHAVTSKYDLTVDEQKVEFLKEASDLVARLPGAVERQVYSMRIASMAGVAEDAVADEVERLRKRLMNRAARSDARQIAKPSSVVANSVSMKYSNPESAAAEEGLIRVLYLEPEIASLVALPGKEEFSSPELAQIYSVLLEKIGLGCEISIETLSDVLTSDELSLLVKILQRPERLSSSRKSAEDCIAKIRNQKIDSSDLRAYAKHLRQTKGYEG